MLILEVRSSFDDSCFVCGCLVFYVCSRLEMPSLSLGLKLIPCSDESSIISIVGVVAGLAYEKCGSEMMVTMWITEISSPFLHLREILKELGYKDTDINLAADVSFAVIFSIARMCVGPYLCYVTLSADNPILIKAMALGLQLVSAFWFFKIARMVKYKFIKRSASKTKSS
ncbi:unnamed protein product [Lactuca virosa]|uniref:TLC domain-containing protein n=1 Tax=Lactuca virosa TaxID=75947 RepID=A0AAU9MNR4_9ASTR|nr:unnamed protein product [Lactuca virosa]